jgi:hypothetical protein
VIGYNVPPRESVFKGFHLLIPIVALGFFSQASK